MINVINNLSTVVVLGTDHYNAIGIVQCLGCQGVDVYVVMRGKKKDSLIASSSYLKGIYEADSFNQAIDIIETNFVNETPAIIIPTGDEAALILEQNADRLKGKFLFQHSSITHPISKIMNKQVQTELASECGFEVPQSVEVSSVQKLNNSIEFPCIIKPLLSCEGDKGDISIANSKSELKEKVSDILTHTPRVLIQHFIGMGSKTTELNILGCGLTSGDAIIPLCINKVKTYPTGKGSTSIGKVVHFTEDQQSIIESTKKLIEKIKYVGLFSIELLYEHTTKRTYFIEMNLRNDATNIFLVKAGANLPYIHVMDLMGQMVPQYKLSEKEMTMICDPIHLYSLLHGEISIKEWMKDVINADSFILYDSHDKRIFFLQFYYMLKRKLTKVLSRSRRTK